MRGGLRREERGKEAECGRRADHKSERARFRGVSFSYSEARAEAGWLEVKTLAHFSPRCERSVCPPLGSGGSWQHNSSWEGVSGAGFQEAASSESALPLQIKMPATDY